MAVTRGARLLALHSGDPSSANSSSVLADIDAALRAAGVKVGNVELFAVARGPGSFTGLRAGLATVKAFGDTLGRPVVGVPTLHAIAHAARPAETLVAYTPAGRGEVFAQTLSVSAEGEVRELSEPAHVAPEALVRSTARSGGGVTWAGAGGAELVEAIRRAAGELGINVGDARASDDRGDAKTWTLAPPVGPLAAHVAALALREYLNGGSLETYELRALYVRASDAELNEKCRASK